MSEVGGMLVALIIAVISLTQSKKWSETKFWGRSLIVLGIIGAILIFINQFKSWKKTRLVEKIEANFGSFEDLDGAILPRLCAGKCTGNGWPVDNSGLFMINNSGPLFRVYVKNNKLFVDVVIRNRDLKPIAVIDGNEWTMFSNDYEYNNDETGFEIVTKGDRKVYFQIYLENGIAHVLGIVTNEEGVGVKFIESPSKNKAPLLDKDHDYEELSIVMILPSGDEDNLKKAYQGVSGSIFKYPRNKYLGVRKKRDDIPASNSINPRITSLFINPSYLAGKLKS